MASRSTLLRASLGGLFAVLLVPAQYNPYAAEPALRVTVTVPPLAWLVAEVAGPEVVVEHLVEAGDAPETFQPTDLRITGVARSALFFRIGVAAEQGPWLQALQDSGRTQVVELRQGLALREMKGHHHGGDRLPSHDREEAGAGHQEGEHHAAGGGMDPHIWLSPRRLEVMAATIARNLAAVDPLRSAGYEERGAGLIARLRALDAELRDRLAPVRGRTFFVFHPAWGYFADDYGLHQAAIEIAGKEPTEAELTRLVRTARAHSVRTLFVQPQIHGATSHTVARAVGARVETLDPLAADLPANLRHVAERLLAALRPAEGGA